MPLRCGMHCGARAVAALTLSSVAWLMAGTGSTAQAEDWPRFRGPNGAGVSATPFNAPLTEQNVLWKITLPGPGHSSPAVWHGRVYLTSGDASTAKRIVLCLDGKTGQTIWKREFDSHTFRQL